MNHQTILPNLTAIFFCLLLLVPICSVVAVASDETLFPSSSDLWSSNLDYVDSKYIYDELKKDGWIKDGVSFDEFDYILVLTRQLAGLTKNVESSLALAMIAVESRFDANAQSDSARGLMQLIPIYHSDRMANFVEEGHLVDLDDFFDPRLNIMTGLDYMDYILEETKGNEEYALMWYNQGALSASRTYKDKGITSDYALTIVCLADKIDQMIFRN